MTKFKNLGLIGTGAIGAAALTIGAAGIAGAQDDEPTLDDPAPAEETDETPERDRGARRQAMIDRLVEDGVITQEQADDVAEVREAIQANREAQRAEKKAAIAEVLGITVEDLEAAREDGTSLADLAGDNLPALVDLFTEQATERIEQAVEDGRFTQEQADEKLAGLDERIQSRIENGGFGGRDGDGHRHGRRGFGQRGGDAPAEAEAQLEEASF